MTRLLRPPAKSLKDQTKQTFLSDFEIHRLRAAIAALAPNGYFTVTLVNIIFITYDLVIFFPEHHAV